MSKQTRKHNRPLQTHVTALLTSHRLGPSRDAREKIYGTRKYVSCWVPVKTEKPHVSVPRSGVFTRRDPEDSPAAAEIVCSGKWLTSACARLNVARPGSARLGAAQPAGRSVLVYMRVSCGPLHPAAIAGGRGWWTSTLLGWFLSHIRPASPVPVITNRWPAGRMRPAAPSNPACSWIQDL